VIDKHIAIICSTGRTGTSFFAQSLPEMVPQSFCVHEPDVWSGLSKRSFDRIRQFGLYHMVIGRLLRTTGLRNLSQNLLAGKLPPERAVEALRRQRDGYYQSISADLIIESNGQWFGLLPILPQTLSSYRFVGIVRDPRTWLASTMNFGRVHGPRDWVTHLGYRRLDPTMFKESESSVPWHEMSRFDRICWTWSATNAILERDIAADENAKLYRYEDLFLGRDRLAVVEDMLHFMTQFSDRSFRYRVEEALLDRRIHSVPRTAFPDWQSWNRSQARRLQEICGSLMGRYGYGAEPEWLDLVG